MTEHTKLYFFDDSASLAYSEADFKRALRDLEETHEILMYLRHYLRPRYLELIGRIATDWRCRPSIYGLHC